MRPILVIFLWFSLSIGLAQTKLDNDTKLISHEVFKKIEIAIPEEAIRLEGNMELLEEMGFTKFASLDEKIEINFNRKEGKKDLSLIKDMLDGLSTALYSGQILRSEIIKVNNLGIFVHEVKGKWNGQGEVIGIFRYYFIAGGDTYELLMIYPADSIEKTTDLKARMIEAIRIK